MMEETNMADIIIVEEKYEIQRSVADELYHHVLDKYGWAWRDPKYKSETELCAMLKWAKEKGLTIEELSI